MGSHSGRWSVVSGHFWSVAGSIRGKCGLSAVLCLALPALAPTAAAAHEINVFASVEGHTIRGKATYHEGEPVRNAVVKAISPAGEEIGQTKTDDEGRFALDARLRCDHRLLVDTGDGHGGAYTLRAEALPKDLPEGDAAQAHDHAKPREHPAAVAAEESAHEHLEEIHDEIVQLREQLDAYEHRARLTDILGGIGYIAGITGVAYYYLGARRKRAG